MSRIERIFTEPADGCAVEVHRRGLGWHWVAWAPADPPVEGAHFQWGRTGRSGWAWRRSTATLDAAWATHALARTAAQADRKADLVARLDAAARDQGDSHAALLSSAAAFLADRPTTPENPA